MENKTAYEYIPAFYAGRCIFITGGTGFMGKVLIEKILRSCPDVANIFVLIRPKKELSINDRLKKMLDNKLFDLLRSTQPSAFDKIIPISGNLAADNLGLLPSDREMLIEKVSIIFHNGANVRFDGSLKDMILNNTRGTLNTCILAENMKQLVVLLYVSTVFTQCDKPVVEEILYPSEIDWKKTIKIAESCDEHLLKILTAKYMKNVPNTYLLSKILAEKVIGDYSTSLPCVIARPSIVVSTWNDPVEGWLDNFNGPIGLMVGAGKGLIRVIRTDPSVIPDNVPVDMVIKVVIVMAWKRGIKTEINTIDIYNCTSNQIKNLTTKGSLDVSMKITEEIPLDNILWKPRTILTTSSFVYYILVLLLHVIPATILDGMMKLFGARSIVLRLYRKVYVMNTVASHFSLNKWTFHNTKWNTAVDNLSADNWKDFGFDYKDLDVHEYYRKAVKGCKFYLLNENVDDLTAAKRHYKRMEWLDKIIKTLFVVFTLWILYKYIATY